MNAKAIAALILLLLLAAGGWWWVTQRPPPPAPDDALLRRAEAACLSNTARDAKALADATVKPKDGGATAGVGLSSSERQDRGAGAALPEAERAAENERIRACIRDYLLAAG